MKRNKIYKYMLGFLLTLMPFSYDASALSADDPSVMDRIIHSSMLPITMSNPLDSGTLLFSDSPEYADKDGILYGDKVSGDCRLYFYHVNQSNMPKKIVVMAYNPSTSPADVIIKGYQYARPNQSYYDVGKELSTLYYEGFNTIKRVTVQPHGYALLGDRLNTVAVQPQDLFSGIVDMTLPTHMYVSSVIMPVDANPVAFMYKQIYLPSDSVKLRGTFHGKDRDLHSLIAYDSFNGIGYVKIGDGLLDRFLEGHDAMDDRVSENTGNYGVDYSIILRTQGTGNLHLYFNPQGGEYAGVAEVIYPDGKNGDGKNMDDKKIVELPRVGLSMGNDNPYAMEYIDSFKAGSTVIVHLMPPGAANLPVRLIVVPDQQLNKAAQDAEELQKLKDSAKNTSYPDWLSKDASNQNNADTGIAVTGNQQTGQSSKKNTKKKRNTDKEDTESTYTPWHPTTIF